MSESESSSSEVKQKTYTAKSKYPLFQPSAAEEADKTAFPDMCDDKKFPSLSKKSNA